MITKPTVLILGAGASVDYEFPTGARLVQDIYETTAEGLKLDWFLKSMGYSRAEIEDFRQALWASQSPSVDLFLEHRRQYEQIGKSAIAASLIPHESEGRFDKPAGWYKFLFSQMVDGGRFEDNPLSVITFNYDRSLEAFFFRALRNFYGLDYEAALGLLARIPIVHMYGSLGGSLWRNAAGERGYTPDLTPQWAREAADRISIMHEVDENGQAIREAKRLLCRAEEVIFLGFGFHAENLRRLGIGEVAKYRSWQDSIRTEWFASRTGMGNGDLERIKSLLTGEIGIRFGSNAGESVTDFLKDTPCFMHRHQEAEKAATHSS